MLPARVENIRPLSDELVQLSNPGHIYTVGEGLTAREAPSLSRVIANVGLVTDYSKVDPEHLAFRARVGTLVHLWIEAYLDKDGDYGFEYESADKFVRLHAEPHMDAFLDWGKGHELVPAYFEVPAYQPILKYACTADYVGLYDGIYAVIDWKSTYKISKTVSLQTMGQAKCFDVKGAMFPFKRFALHLPKKGKAKLVPFTDHANAASTLDAMAVCWAAKGLYL